MPARVANSAQGFCREECPLRSGASADDLSLYADSPFDGAGRSCVLGRLSGHRRASQCRSSPHGATRRKLSYCPSGRKRTFIDGSIGGIGFANPGELNPSRQWIHGGRKLPLCPRVSLMRCPGASQLDAPQVCVSSDRAAELRVSMLASAFDRNPFDVVVLLAALIERDRYGARQERSNRILEPCYAASQGCAGRGVIVPAP